jgi:hypothetical protein
MNLKSFLPFALLSTVFCSLKESGHTKTNYACKSLIKFVRLGDKSVESAGRQSYYDYNGLKIMAFSWYAKCITNTKLETVQRYFADFDSYRIDFYFDYLTEHMFTDATIEDLSRYDAKMSSEHKNRLSSMFTQIQTNYKLINQISEGLFSFLVSEMKYKFDSEGETEVLRKKIALAFGTDYLECAMMAEREILMSIYSEFYKYLVEQDIPAEEAVALDAMSLLDFEKAAKAKSALVLKKLSVSLLSTEINLPQIFYKLPLSSLRSFLIYIQTNHQITEEDLTMSTFIFEQRPIFEIFEEFERAIEKCKFVNQFSLELLEQLIPGVDFQDENAALMAKVRFGLDNTKYSLVEARSNFLEKKFE